jgi:hypothetical protein
LATIPEDEAPQPTVAQRITATVTAPVERHRSIAPLLIAAGAGTFAPDPAGALIAMACVIAAADMSRRK